MEKQNTESITAYSYTFGEYWYDIRKEKISFTQTLDTINEEEIIESDGITYIYHKDVDFNGYIWNDGDYVFRIMGNISKEAMLEIAKSVS